MKTKNCILAIVLISLLGSIGAYSQMTPVPEDEYAFGFYPIKTDTLYLLPQQFLWYNIALYQKEHIENIGAIELKAFCIISEETSSNEPEYTWVHPDYGYETTDDAVYYLNYEYGGWIYRLALNKTLRNHFLVGVMYYYNGMLPEQSFTNCYYSTIINGDLKECYLSEHKTIISIDGYLGDVDGNEIVNMDDLNLLITHTNDDYSKGHYTKEGINYGRGSILFRSYTTLLDVYILNVWLNNPNDPRITDLGIGKLMSTVQQLIPVSIDTSITGDKLNITTEADAVNIIAFSPDGKMWQKSSWVTNNKVTIEIPDPSWSYKVEAVKLTNSALALKDESMFAPASFSLQQNYPNPFNPTTTINYSISKNGLVELRVFDLQGKLVTTLVNENKTAGEYQVQFNATQLSTGTYFYQIKSGSFNQVKKMVFIK